MFKDDPEAETLRCAPGVASLLLTYPCHGFLIHAGVLLITWKLRIQFLDLVLTFEQQMVELCTQLFERGLAEHKKRKTLVDSFFSGQRETVAHYQQEASQMLESFDRQHSEASWVDYYILTFSGLSSRVTWIQ